MNNKTSLQFFISYSHNDKKIKEKLLTSLKSLTFEYNINEIWHDGEIIAGRNIDKEILEQLNKSDVILLLVSANFLSSWYCIDVELKKAIDRMKKNECIVIPIILSSCTISDNLPFSKLKRLPEDGHPIKSRKYFQTQDDGCTNVTDNLKNSLRNDFPNAVIKHKINSNKKQTNNERKYGDVYIELFKNGQKQPVPVSQELIFQIPKYHKAIHDFRTMMEQTILKAKQLYIKEYKELKNNNISISNEFRLKLLRLFLMDICSYTKTYITDNVGIKVHFRISKDDKYIGLIASTANDNNVDLETNWATFMTPIPLYEGLAYHSYRLKAPLLKSLNPKLNFKGKNDKTWKDYVTFTFNKLDNIGQTPSISYCISVNKEYYNIKGDVLKILAYLNLGEIVEKFIKDYCTLCKKIDKDYDLNEIIKSA